MQRNDPFSSFLCSYKNKTGNFREKRSLQRTELFYASFCTDMKIAFKRNNLHMVIGSKRKRFSFHKEMTIFSLVLNTYESRNFMEISSKSFVRKNKFSPFKVIYWLPKHVLYFLGYVYHLCGLINYYVYQLNNHRTFFVFHKDFCLCFHMAEETNF